MSDQIVLSESVMQKLVELWILQSAVKRNLAPQIYQLLIPEAVCSGNKAMLTVCTPHEHYDITFEELGKIRDFIMSFAHSDKSQRETSSKSLRRNPEDENDPVQELAQVLYIFYV